MKSFIMDVVSIGIICVLATTTWWVFAMLVGEAIIGDLLRYLWLVVPIVGILVAIRVVIRVLYTWSSK